MEPSFWQSGGIPTPAGANRPALFSARYGWNCCRRASCSLDRPSTARAGLRPRMIMPPPARKRH